MTEAQWNSCTNPQPMLALLRDRVSERKLRLFARACCSAVSSRIECQEHRKALEGLEAMMDGWHANVKQITSIYSTAETPAEYAVYQLSFICRPFRDLRATIPSLASATQQAGFPVESLCALIRCVFGNPFQPALVDPGWLLWNCRTIEALAEVIYDERRFGDLPMLADALEDAGCTNPEILEHCRGSGPHALGCWVLDILLGKM